LSVSITYQSGGGGNQTPTWAYRIDSPFPGYGSPHGGTQVYGSTTQSNFLGGQPDGSRQVYVALLDQNGHLHNPPITNDTFINYTYQAPSANNHAPFGLGSVSELTIAENRPLQSFVGILTASDPDANDFVSFSLVNGGAESPFAIDANGSVRTTRSLDFELHADHQLFFRATDNHGAFAEGNLTVRVIDIFQPITETREATAVTGSSVNLQGSVIDDGGMTVTNYGFLISTKPQLDNDLNGTTILLAGGQSTDFSVLVTNLQAGKKYFYRAYASNAEGMSYGSVESFSTISESLSPSWIDASPGSAAGWWSSPWLGNFFVSPNGWAMHQELGWVFPVESPTEGLWLWKEGLGWLWTAEGVYPFVHAAATGNWLYFYGQYKGTKLFYDYGRKKWITLEEN
jgi:hypothetical protein